MNELISAVAIVRRWGEGCLGRGGEQRPLGSSVWLRGRKEAAQGSGFMLSTASLSGRSRGSCVAWKGETKERSPACIRLLGSRAGWPHCCEELGLCWGGQ